MHHGILAVQVVVVIVNNNLKMEDELKFAKGDRVKLSFNETGTVVGGKIYAWMKIYQVRIRKATLNKTNQRVEFFERQLQYETENK